MKAVFLALLLLTGCAHYSITEGRFETENIIEAPVDVVWRQTLDLLPSERISILAIDEPRYTIYARKSISFLSWGDDLTIQLFPRTPQKTYFHIEALPVFEKTLLGYGHQEQVAVSLFEKVKSLSE